MLDLLCHFYIFGIEHLSLKLACKKFNVTIYAMCTIAL